MLSASQQDRHARRAKHLFGIASEDHAAQAANEAKAGILVARQREGSTQPGQRRRIFIDGDEDSLEHPGHHRRRVRTRIDSGQARSPCALYDGPPVDRLLQLLYLMAPAYLANRAPPFVRYWNGWNRPISRWLGEHKTVGGALAGDAIKSFFKRARHRARAIVDSLKIRDTPW
jgi:hypothetical protein